MDSVKSFKGYGKVDEAEDQAFRKKARKRLIILVVSVIVLLLVVTGAVVGTVIHNRKNDSPDFVPAPQITPAASIKAMCRVTQYPQSCFSSISSLTPANTTDPEILFKFSLHAAINELQKISEYPAKLVADTNDKRLTDALSVCQVVFDDALDRLNDSISAMEVKEGTDLLDSSKIEDLKTWLSASISDQDTCIESLDELKLNSTSYQNSTVINDLKIAMQNSTEFTSNSLAIVAKVLSVLTDFGIPIHRRLLGVEGDFPSWVNPGVRRLLQVGNPTPNVTVATDGTGNFTTIKDAIATVPKKNMVRYVIYLKAGVYKENVIIDKGKWNIMIYGDGKDKTIVSAGLNFIDGTPTYDTATFAVQGRGFFAKDITFINTAGAEKHQAVAFRSGSDLSVYSGCAFDGYQDTLYSHSNRQFYTNCDITGTIDFIFGYAAVVFQNCRIQPREPLKNQFNTITAEGKKDPNQNSGISIQKCEISPNGIVNAPTYLGRPWKEYATTVIMQSSIGSFLRPKGWMEWVSGVEPPRTIFYAEYKNTGPGSNVDQRVKWAGYRPALTDQEAMKFTVGTFLEGNNWLPAAGVSFEQSL